jgi:hypothetical protein
MSGKESKKTAAAIANAANAKLAATDTSTASTSNTTPTATAKEKKKEKKKKTDPANAAANAAANQTAAAAQRVATANAAVSSSSSTPTAATPATTTSSKNISSRSVSFHPNAKMSNGPKASPKAAASLAEAATAPVVAAAANAATNAKDREICFIYSNALTKDKFNKGCIIVYKGATSSPDHSATMLEQLVAQKDIQAVEGGLQKSFVHPVDDKTSLFIAYVEVTTMPTDEQITAMKMAISIALPKTGGKRKRFHTKKRHAKKRTTRRS